MDKDWRPNSNSFEKAAKKEPKVEHKEHKPAHEPKDAENILAPDDVPSSPINTKLILFGVGLVICLLAFFFLVLPGIKGYTLYKTMKENGVPEEYVTNTIALNDAKVAVEQQLSAAQTQLLTCETDRSTVLATAATEKQQATEQITALQTTNEQQAEQLTTLTQEAKDKDTTIENAARRICCIARVENPTINAYAIVDNKVTCVSEGGTGINC
jgi:hypothetical protein